LTPNGSIIEKKGITPDIEVKESEDYNKDLVLEKALDFIKIIINLYESLIITGYKKYWKKR
jgi:C-terminal processing protease CtpA/Prc